MVLRPSHIRVLCQIPGGFTMAELLMAISVVLVLGALFFPAFSGISRKAGVGKCLNNQRQITAAYLSFLNDTDGKLWYRQPSDGWSGGSGPMFGGQNSINTPGYLCQALEPYGLKRAVFNAYKPITNRAQTVWYCPASINQTAIVGHGATYYYEFLGKKIGATGPVPLAAVSEHLSSVPYLRDYYGNHANQKKLYPTTHNVYSYLDGHSEYR